jgi:hypothetical protein
MGTAILKKQCYPIIKMKDITHSPHHSLPEAWLVDGFNENAKSSVPGDLSQCGGHCHSLGLPISCDYRPNGD